MKSNAQAMSGQAKPATANARQSRRNDAVSGKLALVPAVADQGKIRLGGAWRLPAGRKAA